MKLLVAVLLFSFLMSCKDEEREKAYNDCVLRGVIYFKEIESYPKLTSGPNIGRKAEEVAKERCRRSKSAF